nr:immunoglobulin heavy chain junction region [Macaca mulatta]MOV53558.1 immunoglobulin heavy chain junction region [Macaca mulatta]MOV54992.1 immunoglobulin heavy chain junction region [Macaca mulatta]MOV55793.1 immunoglobulin heavy chain junction region [Macaca mulatta]MOV55905.1 immunoglobulin heavy chain junction region [Macaca mulatta]
CASGTRDCRNIFCSLYYGLDSW